MRRLSFRQRQFLTLLLLAIVLLVGTMGTALPISRDAIIQRAAAQLEVVADLKTVQVRHWINQGREVAHLVASRQEVREAFPRLLILGPVPQGERLPNEEDRALARANLYATIEAIVVVFPYVRSVSLLHPTDGQVMLSTDRTQEGRERRGEYYFQAGRQVLYISPVTYSASHDVPVLIVSAPVQDESDGLLAVVVVEMDLADLEAVLSDRTGLGLTGRNYLVEAHNGAYVTLPPDIEGTPLRTVAESEGVRHILDRQGGSGTYLDPRGVRVLGVYRWLPTGNLGLLVEMEETELIGQIVVTWVLLALVGLGLLALAVVVARYLTNWLMVPLERIAAAARTLRAGDLNHRVPPGGPDEIGQLAAAFNEMADSLQRSYEDLEQLVEQRTSELWATNEQLQRDIAMREQVEETLQRRMEELSVLHAIAVAGAGATSLDALIETATEVIGGMLYPDNFGVGLVDETAGVLRIHHSYRGIPEEHSSLTIPLEQGIVGQVATSGQSRRVPDVTCEPAYLEVVPDTRSELCVPLRAGERVIGVLNAESRYLDAFSEDDERLMVTLAGQLATAMEKVRLFEEVQQLAITDPLTGLHNRRHFFELAQHEFDRAQRYGRPLSALMLDLDHFKRVNDTYGHLIGDQVLRAVADRCQQRLRQTDVLGRYGGEEFAVLLPETDRADAQRVAEQLRQWIAQMPVDTEQGPIAITISLGVGALNGGCANLDALLQRADQALYTAKRAGRNRVRVWQN